MIDEVSALLDDLVNELKTITGKLKFEESKKFIKQMRMRGIMV